jgi:hypothetical protein
MVKNLIQDVVPKKSIRNIPVSEKRTVRATKPKVVVEEDYELKSVKPESKFVEKFVEEKEEPIIPELEEDLGSRYSDKKPTSKKKIFIGGGIVVAFIALFLTLNAFHSVKVTVTPKSFNATVSGEIVAKRAAGALDMPFESMLLKKEGAVVVKSTGQQNVQKKATGTIVIFNNHSTAPQRLIKNTRFETPEGLIYKIDSSVTIPGKKGTVPGSVEANVSADEVGDKYNVGLTDFTIPGFKGDPRFTNFYGRSKTPMAGGFNGVMKIVSDTDRKSAEEEIKSKLSSEIFKKAQSKVPEGFVLYPKAYRIDWNNLPEESLDADQVRIKIEGVFTASVFNKKSLASYLARTYITEYKGEAIEIKNIDELSVIPKSQTWKPSTDSSVTLSVTGNALFVWSIDEMALKQAMLGKPKSAFSEVLNGFNMIEKADAKATPFWKRSFPDNVEKILIESTL